MRAALVFGLLSTALLPGQRPARQPAQKPLQTLQNAFFQLRYPGDWQRREYGGRFPMLAAPERQGFAANLNISMSGRRKGQTLGALFKREKGNLRRLFPRHEVLGEGEVPLGEGLSCRYLRIHNQVAGRRLQQTFYLVAAARQFFTLTCSRLQGSDAGTDRGFAQILRSFRPVPAPAPDTQGRFVDRVAGVAYQVPKGWQLRRLPQQALVAMFGPRHQGFETNVLLAQEAVGGDLEQYLQALRGQFRRLDAEARFGQERALALPFGRPARTVELRRRLQGRSLRQRICVIEQARGRKLIITLTAHLDAPGELDKAFATWLRSLRPAPD